MPESGTSGSVGTAGERSPAVTRLLFPALTPWAHLTCVPRYARVALKSQWSGHNPKDLDVRPGVQQATPEVCL